MRHIDTQSGSHSRRIRRDRLSISNFSSFLREIYKHKDSYIMTIYVTTTKVSLLSQIIQFKKMLKTKKKRKAKGYEIILKMGGIRHKSQSVFDS